MDGEECDGDVAAVSSPSSSWTSTFSVTRARNEAHEVVAEDGDVTVTGFSPSHPLTPALSPRERVIIGR
jgi:hypothetical protein